MENLLLQIRLAHRYYDGDLAQSMRLQPDLATQNFFSRYRLIDRQAQGVYALHYFGSGAIKGFAQSLTRLLEGRPPVFYLLSYDNCFAVITDLPVNWCGQLQYSSTHIVAQTENSADASLAIELAMQLQPRTINRTSVVGHVSIFPLSNS